MSNSIYSDGDKYHYTYLITELSSGRMYIGLRSSIEKPYDDIGVHYFSSSQDEEFMKNQKMKPSDYKYEVLNEFDTRKEAFDNEIHLHKTYSVSQSNSYINRANSTDSGFDMYGKIVVRDNNGDTMVVSTDDPRYLSGELKHHSKGNIDRSLASKNMKTRWDTDYEGMKEKIHNPESNALRGKAQSDWIKANPEAHQERMMKINKNPEKIAKMAEKHRGMKRSDETKANIKAAKKAAIAKLSDEERGKIYGKGNVYVTDLTTYVYRSEPSDYVLKENELYGMVKDPKAPLKKRAVVTNINTWREYWREVGYVLEDHERKGNVLAVKKKMRERGELV